MSREMTPADRTARGDRQNRPSGGLCAPVSQSAGGFSLAELITVCAIIAVLSAIAMPVARLGFRRQREVDLRERIRKITDAIDRYHDLRVAGRIKDPKSIEQGDYPKDLDELLKGVELIDGTKTRFIRERDLIDPMTGKNDWVLLSTSDDPDATSGHGGNVFEVRSSSHALALDGKTHYNEW
jgi:general secretion pathway protein G